MQFDIQVDSKTKLTAIAVVLLIAIFGGLFWYMEHLRREVAELKASQQPIVVQRPDLAVNMAGKQVSPTNTQPQVIYIQGQNTETRTISYVPKEVDPVTGQREKTDVQVNPTNRSIFVKYRDKIFEMPVNNSEQYKFQDGKLVIETADKSTFEVVAPDISKWSVSALTNADKKYAGEVTYHFDSLVGIKALAGQGMKPWYGLEFSIGNLNAKSKQ